MHEMATRAKFYSPRFMRDRALGMPRSRDVFAHPVLLEVGRRVCEPCVTLVQYVV